MDDNDSVIESYYIKETFGAKLTSLAYDPSKEIHYSDDHNSYNLLNCRSENFTCDDSINDEVDTVVSENSWIDFLIPGICVTDIAKTLSSPLEIVHYFDNNEDVMDIRSIRFINFNDLKLFSSLPKYNDNKNICIDYNTIKRQFSLFIYVSHLWHTPLIPDNSDNDKFQLIISAIERIKNQAKGFSKIYVHIDYCCCDQKSIEYQILDKIIETCDLVVTPVVDKDNHDWDLIDTCTAGFLHDYKAKNWNDYLRVKVIELLFAGSIPLYPDTDKIANLRKSKLSGALLQAMKQGRRAHFIFGTKEREHENEPYLLPALHNEIPALATKYDLRKKISKESDQAKIEFLYEKLNTYIFLGSVSASIKGKENAKMFENGDIHFGDIRNNKKHGRGFLIMKNGSSYEGKFKYDTFNDKKGKYTMNNGDQYIGGFTNGKRNGPGVFTRVYNNVIEQGIWKDDKLVKQLESSDKKCSIM